MLEETMQEMEKGLCEALSMIAKKGAAITPTELDNATKAVCLLEHIGAMRDGDSSRSYRMHHDGASNARGRDNGYSGHSIKDRMIATLEQMMDNAGGDYEKRIVQDWIRRLDSER